MLNNGITSLTCIHCEAGIKPSVQREGKKTEKKEGRKGKRDRDESETIKNRSAAYLLQKRRPRGREEEGDEEGGSGGEWGNGKGGMGRRKRGLSSIRCI